MNKYATLGLVFLVYSLRCHLSLAAFGLYLEQEIIFENGDLGLLGSKSKELKGRDLFYDKILIKSGCLGIGNLQ